MVACDGSPQVEQADDELSSEVSTPAAPRTGRDADAAAYAKIYGVSLDEAARRLDLQVPLGDVDVALREAEPTFGGLWIEHRPAFRVVVAFTDPAAAARSTAAVRAVATVDDVAIRIVRYTLDELERNQLDAIAAIKTTGMLAESQVTVAQNQVELYVSRTDEPRLAARLAGAGRTLATSVAVVPVDRFSEDFVLHGGSALNSPDGDDSGTADDPACTAGFTVNKATGEHGILTAAHCPNSLRPSSGGAWLGVTSARQGGSHDVQWHKTCGVHDVSDDFYICAPASDAACVRDATGTVHRNNQVIGTFVRKFGRTTQDTAGTIESKTFCPVVPPFEYSPTFVRVAAPDGNPLALPGDSGGPWFVNGNAYGILKGAPGDDLDDSFYMPINYITDLFLRVNTTDPAGPGCTICNPAGFACVTTDPSTCCSNSCVPIGVGQAGTCG
jgi:hypothetical protein